MITPEIQKLIKQFKKAELSQEDRSVLMATILNKISALPLHNTFNVSQGTVTLNGKELEPEQALSFIESCVALKDNHARKIIHEQIRYLAINLGVHQGLNTDMILFSKAALWILEQETILLEQVV